MEEIILIRESPLFNCFLELSNQELILPIHMFDFFFFELSNLKLILPIHVDIIV